MAFTRWGFGLVGVIGCVAWQASAAPIHYQVTINPIQVCDGSGVVCANPARQLFLAETDKLWRQAGVDVKFLDWKQYNNGAYLNDASTGGFLFAPNAPTIGGSVINMWFVQTLDGGGYGQGSSLLSNVVIGDNVFSYSSGKGRRDTIAHEVGHVLGLPHIDGLVPENLMEEGGDRDPVISIEQISPTGHQGQLNASQISTVLNSSRVASMDYSILGDADLSGVVDEADIALFVAGWRHQQQDPGLDTWMRGDFNHDAVTDLHDAFILRTALRGNSAALSAMSETLGATVPEPTTLCLLTGVLGLGWCVRKRR